MLTDSINTLAPVVLQLKSAYDQYEAACEDDDADNDNFDHVYTDDSSCNESITPPPPKTPKLSVLNQLDNSVKRPTNCGPAINLQLAKLVENLLQHGMDAEAKESMLLKYLKPDNCPRLEVVKVNPDIYNSVRRNTKQEDFALQKLQQPLIAGITAVIEVLNAYVQAELGEGRTPTAETVMPGLSNAVSLLCDSCHELDIRRRIGFKHDIREEFRPLCGNSTPVTSMLFGDDLGESVKALAETSKVTKQIVGPTSQRFWKAPRGQLARRPPFLGSSPRGRGFPRTFQPNRPQNYRQFQPRFKQHPKTSRSPKPATKQQ